jgi:hypothetical protein
MLALIHGLADFARVVLFENREYVIDNVVNFPRRGGVFWMLGMAIEAHNRGNGAEMDGWLA